MVTRGMDGDRTFAGFGGGKASDSFADCEHRWACGLLARPVARFGSTGLKRNRGGALLLPRLPHATRGVAPVAFDSIRVWTGTLGRLLFFASPLLGDERE